MEREESTLFASYQAAQNMEYFQWLERRLMAMQEGAVQRLIGANSWDDARMIQGQIDALRMVLAAMVPDEARL